jgi:hypothetical protein
VAASQQSSSLGTSGFCWNLDRDLPKYTPRFNVAPETSPNIPVIVRRKGSRECRLVWG